MRNVLMKAVAVAGAAVAVGMAVAAPASAEPIEPTPVWAGSYSYDDGGDLFCAKATNTDWDKTPLKVEVRLTAISRPGPSRTFRDYNDAPGYNHPGRSCRSLATAYEDTYYKAVVTSHWYDSDRGSWVKEEEKVRHFHS